MNGTTKHRNPLLPFLAAGVALSLFGCVAGEGAELSGPVTVTSAGATTPTVAATPDGDTAYVTWVETRGDVSDVLLARIGPSGAPLGGPVRVNSSPGDASTHEQAPPQVAVGPRGEVYVVWQKSTPLEGRRHPASDLRFAASTDGGRTFGPTMSVNDDVGGIPTSHNFHDVVVAGDGTVYVSWIDGRERDRARAEQGGHGHAHESGDDLPPNDLRVASLRPGETAFAPAMVVDRDVCPCCRTSLAVAEDGTLYLAWRKVFPGSIRDVAFARSTDGGRSFSRPVPVHRDGWVHDGCPHAGPSVAVDGEGGVHVAWYTGREGRQGLFRAVSTDGRGRFGAPRALLSDGWVPPSLAKLQRVKGELWVAWEDRRGEEPRIHYGRIGRGGEVVEMEDVPGTAPALASGRSPLLAWRDGDTIKLSTRRER